MIRDDQLLFIPLCAGITLVLLLWLVPHVAMAMLCLAIVPFTLIATLGTMALCGIELTLLTSSLPVLLMCMAVTGGVHLVGRFAEERGRGRDPSAAAAHTLARLLFPCFLTALTTAVGFLTLAFTDLPDLRQLGYFAAAGVGYAYLFTILVMPAALSMVQGRPGRVRLDLPRALTALAVALSLQRPSRVLLPAGVLLLAAAYQASHVQQDNHIKGDLWDESEAARAIQYYEQRFLSMAPSEVVVKSEKGFGHARAQAQLEELVQWLESLPPVDRCLSLADLIRDEMPMWLVRGAGALGGLLSRDGRTARILVFQADLGNRYLSRFREDVREKGASLSELDVRVAGVQVVATTLVDRLTKVLSSSFIGSLLVIFVLVWWHFRSLRLGLIAIVTNLFPLVLNLAYMSLASLELRPLTVISFCVAFGLAVDDTIHLLARYREERQAGAGRDSALRTTLQTAGRPVVVTTLLLLVGFLVILSSGFRGTHQFGALVSLALAGSLLGALFLMPALLRVTSSR
jgi:predicted RND superfamily exporter protein